MDEKPEASVSKVGMPSVEPADIVREALSSWSGTTRLCLILIAGAPMAIAILITLVLARGAF